MYELWVESSCPENLVEWLPCTQLVLVTQLRVVNLIVRSVPSPEIKLIALDVLKSNVLLFFMDFVFEVTNELVSDRKGILVTKDLADQGHHVGRRRDWGGHGFCWGERL